MEVKNGQLTKKDTWLMTIVKERSNCCSSYEAVEYRKILAKERILQKVLDRSKREKMEREKIMNIVLEKRVCWRSKKKFMMN